MGRPASDAASRSAAVLSKAVVRASTALGLSQKDLAAIIGVSEATASRLHRGRPVPPETKEGELALLLLRVYRGLATLVGGRDDLARAWMHAPNDHLGGVPAERVRTAAGLVGVAAYLDGMRGKL